MKRITILHSNDMHGDFLAESRGNSGVVTGGLALLSGYVNKVRLEEDHVLYVIAGDMVQGSLIDFEYKGISTIEIMNYLAPDVVTLGNHELDYGLKHLLFLEKMAMFPIVNANLYIKTYHKRLMTPHVVIQKGGLNILFIGIITEKVMDSIARDLEIGTFITLEEAKSEIGRICDTYRNDDIDLTVLLTHIGIQSDQELARMLDPAWGVDIIIGGHSHTILDRPIEVNQVLITQAGVGTCQIGRFDLIVDEEQNRISRYEWKLVPVSEESAPPDQHLLMYIDSFKKVVDRKYNTLICRFPVALTHPSREVESPLGNLVADIYQEVAQCDVMLVGSGSIRQKELGPAVTLGDLKACFPIDDPIKRFSVRGDQVRAMFSRFMHPENRNGEGECYQVSYGVVAVYDDHARKIEAVSLNGVPIDDNRIYSLGLLGYHVDNCQKNLGITLDELTRLSGTKVVATSATGVLEEYLRAHPGLERRVEGRLVYHRE